MDAPKPSPRLDPKKHYRVRHILFARKHEAEDVLRRLSPALSTDQLDAQFAKLAQQHSLCPSAAHGGDLGLIPWKKADPDFEDAVVRLAAGECTREPVRTRFGYHLILRLG